MNEKIKEMIKKGEKVVVDEKKIKEELSEEYKKYWNHFCTPYTDWNFEMKEIYRIDYNKYLMVGTLYYSDTFKSVENSDLRIYNCYLISKVYNAEEKSNWTTEEILLDLRTYDEDETEIGLLDNFLIETERKKGITKLEELINILFEDAIIPCFFKNLFIEAFFNYYEDHIIII